DGVILEVLIRKHKAIKNDLGVTVAVPGSSEQIAEALFEGALFREQTRSSNRQLAFTFIVNLDGKKPQIHQGWDRARDGEKPSRSRFGQHTLRPEAVAAELQNVRRAIGRSDDVARFFRAILHSTALPVQEASGALTVRLSPGTPRTLRQAIGM